MPQICAAAGTVLLVLAFLVGVIEAAAFDRQFYAVEYEKNNTAAYVGTDYDTLSDATKVLLQYLTGDRPNLDMETVVGGTVREYYNEREKLHMADVRDLNIGAIAFMWIGFAAGGVLLGYACFAAVQRYRIWRTCFWTILGVLAAFGALGVWGAVDFGSFWTTFHRVFFRNDLWLFDPRTSLLIRMFEEQFFYDLVARILAWFLGGTFAVLAAVWILYRIGKRKQADA